MPVQPSEVPLRTPPSRGPHPDELETLPSGYGEDLLILKTRDPWWIHAYWELKPSTVASARARLGQEGPSAQMTLRVYEEPPAAPDLTPPGPMPSAPPGPSLSAPPGSAPSLRWFDIHLTGDTKDWYVGVEPPHRAWWAQIGLKSPSGQFLALAQSNRVFTPPATPSERIDEGWGWLPIAEWVPHGASAGWVRPVPSPAEGLTP